MNLGIGGFGRALRHARPVRRVVHHAPHGSVGRAISHAGGAAARRYPRSPTAQTIRTYSSQRTVGRVIQHTFTHAKWEQARNARVVTRKRQREAKRRSVGATIRATTYGELLRRGGIAGLLRSPLYQPESVGHAIHWAGHPLAVQAQIADRYHFRQALESARYATEIPRYYDYAHRLWKRAGLLYGDKGKMPPLIIGGVDAGAAGSVDAGSPAVHITPSVVRNLFGPEHWPRYKLIKTVDQQGHVVRRRYVRTGRMRNSARDLSRSILLHEWAHSHQPMLQHPVSHASSWFNPLGVAHRGVGEKARLEGGADAFMGATAPLFHIHPAYAKNYRKYVRMVRRQLGNSYIFSGQFDG